MLFEQMEPGCENRFLGEIRSDRMFGVGVIDKSGKTVDQVDLNTDHYTLVYLVHGRAEYVDWTVKTHQLGKGDFFQRIPGRCHTTRIIPDSRYREFYVMISLKSFEACREIGFIPVDKPVGTLGSSLELVTSFLHLRDSFRASSLDNQQALAMDCQNFLFKFFVAVRNRQFGDYWSELIESACARLTADLKNACDLELFCRTNRCSYHSFRRKFKEYTGVSPARYRIQRRLDTAYSLLLQGELTISEIAWRLGYSSPYEFSNQFKKYFGSAPSFMRKGEG